MSVAIPQVRMEIFRGPPKFFDDNFVKGWSVSGHGTFETDGDVVTITIDAGEGYGAIEKAVSFNTNPYRYAIIRCTELAGDHWAILFKEGVTSHVTKVFYDTGIKTIDLYTEKGAHFDCDKIVLMVYKDTSGDTGKFDYLGVCKNTMLIPVDETKSDIVENLTVTLPLLNRGVAGFSCKLPNMNAEYTDEIADFDHILIYLWRKGASMKKVFGGKILLPGTEGFGPSQAYYLLLSGMDIGQELLVPPSLMKKIYDDVNGKTVVEDAVDLCTEVTKKFVDVDDDIASTHDFQFEEVKPYAVITKICGQAKTLGGLVGFDGYVDPAGNLHIFKRGKYTSSIDLTGKMEHYKKEDDVHRVRNKTKAYGMAEKFVPVDSYPKDAWTEGSILNWTSSGTVGQDSDSQVGNYSIRGIRLSEVTIYLRRTIDQISCKYSFEYRKLHFWVKLQASSGSPSSIAVSLLAPDWDNRFGFFIDNVRANEWCEYNVDLGPDADWNEIGSPDWENIQGVDFYFANDVAADLEINIDGLYFGKARFSGEAEDATSQSKYGVRWEEPVVDDSLKSDNECLKKAESLRDFLKDKVTTLSDFKVEGDNGFTPGDRQLVTISNDNINDYFRILEIRHVLRGVQWDTVLTLSNEPQMVDYVFADLHRELRRLSVSKGKGNPGGGTAGERHQACSRVVCPVGYKGATQWDQSDLQAAIDSLYAGQPCNFPFTFPCIFGGIQDGTSPCPLYAIEKCDFYDIQLAIDGVSAYPLPPPGEVWCIFPFDFPCKFYEGE